MKRILVVDDSPRMRQMVAFTLEGAGFGVVQASDGKDAMTKLSGKEYPLFLSDLNMHGMDGLEFTRQLSAVPAYKFVPIIFLTTESDVAGKQLPKAAGATGWSVKPFEPDKLVALVNKVMR